MRLRQIALVGTDLAAASQDIVDVLGLGGAYVDPGVGKYGLVNAVWPVGDTFLEALSPKAPGTTAGRLLQKRGGDGGYMVILQADEIAPARARIKAQGVRVVDQLDGDGFWMTHLHPRDMGGAILSVDAMIPADRWQWGGSHWREQVRTDTSVAIVGAELQGEDPRAMAARWAAVLGREAAETAEGWRLGLDGGELRFVGVTDGRGEGLGAFDVAVHDVAQVRARAERRGLIGADGEVLLCGTRVRLVAA